MYKYLFGPVPSRRLGSSLGIDLAPRKLCSLDCVYCEVGRTTKLTTARKEYVKFDKVKAELEHYFDNFPDTDYFTFSGSGEPTLNSRIGDVIRFVKNAKPQSSVAVLTNGTLFSDKAVRDELREADLVLPSLDAATQDVLEKINSPAPDLTAERHISGLIDFAEEFEGKIWLEIFILPGFNDSESHLQKLKDAALKIKPDLIQLNSLDRPGAISNLRSASREELVAIKNAWNMDNIEIISRASERKNSAAYREDAETAIYETISRRPCTIDDLAEILTMRPAELGKYLDVLESAGKIEAERLDRGVFYKIV